MGGGETHPCDPSATWSPSGENSWCCVDVKTQSEAAHGEAIVCRLLTKPPESAQAAPWAALHVLLS